MDPAELAALKEYLRVDHNEDDGLLVRLHRSAVEYLSGAGVPRSDTALYRLAVFGQVRKLYDDVEAVPGLQGIINQLKMQNLSAF